MDPLILYTKGVTWTKEEHIKLVESLKKAKGHVSLVRSQFPDRSDTALSAKYVELKKRLKAQGISYKEFFGFEYPKASGRDAWSEQMQILQSDKNRQSETIQLNMYKVQPELANPGNYKVHEAQRWNDEDHAKFLIQFQQYGNNWPLLEKRFNYTA